jgi:hypothetical protein
MAQGEGLPIAMQNPEQGLAAGLAKTAPMRDLDQIIQMLMQGMQPDELLQQGVPMELVQAAMEQISRQMTQVSPEQAGLAAAQVQAMPR